MLRFMFKPKQRLGLIRSATLKTTNSFFSSNSSSGAAADAGEEAKKGKNWQHIRRLLQLAKPETKSIILAVGLLFTSSSITMSMPYFMGRILDVITKPEVILPGGLSWQKFSIGVLGLVSLGALANSGRIYLLKTTGERIVARLRTRLFASLIRQDMTFFGENMSGALVSRLTTDVALIGRALSMNLSDGLRNGVMGLVGFSMMFYVSPTLTGVMLLVVPPIALGSVLYGRVVKRLSKKTLDAQSEAAKYAEERFMNVRLVQAMTREAAETKQFSEKADLIYRLAKKEAIASGTFFGGAGFSGNVAILAILGMGGRLVMHGQLSVGDLTSFFLYTLYAGLSFSGLASFYSETMKAMGICPLIFQLIDRKPLIPIISNEGKRLTELKGELTFENVTFRYPNRAEQIILKDLTFTVPAHKTLALAGSSGSGKSTIASLLLRFYEPEKGRILVDGVDLNELDLLWWRSQIGWVSQEPVLFQGTIRENLVYGNPGATEQEIQQSLDNSNCQFVKWFPDGLETLVGERGLNLSGGQKQRVAIAQAMIKNPKILILDEATSALDAVNEKLVKDAMTRLKENRTVLSISHRSSMLSLAEQVVCLAEGEVKEQGPVEELLRRQGILYNLISGGGERGGGDEHQSPSSI